MICLLQVAQYLIEKGTNIEAKNEYQKTPLHFECEKGHLPIVQYLIEKGNNIKEKDDEKWTPYGGTDVAILGLQRSKKWQILLILHTLEDN